MKNILFSSCDVEAAISMAEETFHFTVGVTTTPRLVSTPPRLQTTHDIEKVLIKVLGKKTVFPDQYLIAQKNHI